MGRRRGLDDSALRDKAGRQTTDETYSTDDGAYRINTIRRYAKDPDTSEVEGRRARKHAVEDTDEESYNDSDDDDMSRAQTEIITKPTLRPLSTVSKDDGSGTVLREGKTGGRLLHVFRGEISVGFSIGP